MGHVPLCPGNAIKLSINKQYQQMDHFLQNYHFERLGILIRHFVKSSTRWRQIGLILTGNAIHSGLELGWNAVRAACFCFLSCGKSFKAPSTERLRCHPIGPVPTIESGTFACCLACESWETLIDLHCGFRGRQLAPFCYLYKRLIKACVVYLELYFLT